MTTGDLINENGKTYLVAPVSSETIDALAVFEAEGEDRESADLEDEPGSDDENSLADTKTPHQVFDDREGDNSDLELETDEEECMYRESDACLAAMVQDAEG